MKNFTLSFNAQHRLTAAKLAAAVALLIACSKISFSIGPVPLTMQTFGVALIGAVLGARLGFSAVLSYLLLGFAGLPVFATPLCGPAVFFGPTAGYLVVFPFAAALAGFLAQRGFTGKRFIASFFAQSAVNILIVAGGALWLSFTIGAEKAIAVGFLPFVIGAFLKSVLGAAVLYAGTLFSKRK